MESNETASSSPMTLSVTSPGRSSPSVSPSSSPAGSTITLGANRHRRSGSNDNRTSGSSATRSTNVDEAERLAREMEALEDEVLRKGFLHDLDHAVVEMLDESRGIALRDRKYHLRTYRDCFIGRDGVDWLCRYFDNCSREVGVQKGRFLLALGYVRHVIDRQKPFADDFGFYVFTRRARAQCNHVKRARARLAQLTVEDVLVNMMDVSSGVSVRDRKWHLKTYRQAFVGADATTWLTEFLFCDRDTGVQRGQEMVDAGYIRDVSDANKPFADDGHLYVFTEEAQRQLSQSRRRLDAGLELDSLTAVVQAMMHPLSGVPCKDRKRGLRTFKDSFTGEAATDWMIQHLRIRSREDATAFGQTLMSEGYLDSDHANSFLDHSSKYYRWAFTSASLPRNSSTTGAAADGATSVASSSSLRRDSNATNSGSTSSLHSSGSSTSLASSSSSGLPSLGSSPTGSSASAAAGSTGALPLPGSHAQLSGSGGASSTASAVASATSLDALADRAAPSASLKGGSSAGSLPRAAQTTGALPVLSPRKAKVSAGDFEQLRVLGVGGFGRVFQVRQKGTGKVYAMKVIPKSKLKSERDLRNLLSERNILRNTHTFLLHMHWAWQSADKLYMVMDYLGGGDLFFHLQQHRGGFARKTVQFFVAEVLLALEYLHSCGVLYRDMKLENVLLDHYGHVCLADFGLSKMLNEDTDRTTTMCGTPGYLAPEILQSTPYGTNVDLWSLGVLMFELSTGVNPFLGRDTHETLKNILNLHVRFPPSHFSPQAASLLRLLLQRDPALRPQSADQIKSHSYFKGIDWRRLLLRRVKPPFQVTVEGVDDVSNFDPTFTRLSISIQDEEPRLESSDLGKPSFKTFSFSTGHHLV
mmetsp:Transcript_12516/g.37923  ORF Transcript_12516/g.37923 Transcript_12516/m.37923 type:complete len:869 (+) Transcript_12516:44-2650(+)